MPYVSIDTETGGFKSTTDALLSVALVEHNPDLSPGRSMNVFLLPEPGKVINEGAAKVNGYTPELWAARGAVPLVQGMQQIKGWLTPGSRAIAFNAPFDRDFYTHNESMAKVATGLAPDWICALKLFRALVKRANYEVQNHKLDSLAQVSGHWKVGHVRGDHQALDDAIACAVGYQWIMQKYKEYKESPF